MSNSSYSSTRSLEENEIRLIRILPGNWKDEIQCELVYDSLRTIRPYYTLSYVWGSPRVTRQILVDGRTIFVTVNLESALRHLRSRMQGSFLWVDALCINQADNEERTHQVKMMGSIYRLSKSVLVYLGDGVGRDGRGSRWKVDETSAPITAFSEDDEKDRSKIETFLQSMKITTPDYKKPATRKTTRTMQDTVQVFSLVRALCCVPHLTDVPLFSPESHSSDAKPNLIRVFENLRQLMHAPFTPWWNRIWVVQEVVLPPQVTIICGTVSAPWTVFARAATRYLQHVRHCCSGHAESLPRDCLNVLKDFCHRVQDIEDLRSTMKSRSDNAELTNALVSGTKKDAHGPEQRSLISLLRRFRSRKASDPRDKVYALLSLVQSTSSRPPLYPDYSLSDVDVYMSATLEAIYCSSSLSVLSLDIARKYRPDLPSWVPDFEAPGDFSHDSGMEITTLYNSCNDFPVDPSTVAIRGRALRVRGRYITRVAHVGDAMLSDSPESVYQMLSDWFKFWDRSAHPGDSLPWRLLFADVIHSPQSTDMRESFRRAELDDEIMFVTWTLLSKLSPFEPASLHRFSLSQKAMAWRDMLLLEIAVATKKPEIAALHFQTLFPSPIVRKNHILHAYNLVKEYKESEVPEYDHEDSTDIATLSLEELKSRDWQKHIASKTDDSFAISDAQVKAEYLACCQQSERRRLQAWRRIPWPELLRVVRPQLLKALGGASHIGSMAHDAQVSIMDSSIISATKARRLFVTDDRKVGLGPADLAERDFVFLIKGGRTPFILRREWNTDIEAAASFKVVGDCYASQLMDWNTVEESLKIGVSETGWDQVLLWRGWQWIYLV